MDTSSQDTTETRSGETLRRVALCAVYLGALTFAVLCSPAAGLVDLRPHGIRLAAVSH